MKIYTVSVICAFFLCVSVTALNAHADEPKNKATYRIGVIYGFSGPAEKWSYYGKQGLELAKNQINESGGIDGRAVELIYEDNQTAPLQSVTAFQKLLNTGGVSAIIASNWSVLTNPLIPLAEKYKIVTISPTVMDASIESKSDYFFTMGYRVESIKAPLERFYQLNPQIKKVVFLCWDDAWGKANLKVWQEVAKEKGVDVADTICQGDYGNDFRTDVTRAAAKKPDAIFVGMYAERVAKRARELGLKATIFTTSVVLEPLVEPSVDKTLLEGMYLAYWQPHQKFIDLYRKTYQEEPLLEAHNHYEVVRSIAKALEKSPENVREGLRRLRYNGVAGMIDFKAPPIVNEGPAKLMKIEGGKMVEVE
jgi:branched-chain amino acid transport system substrate-binding protein